MNSYRYFKWNGTEPFELDREKLMDELSRKLMQDGNLARALWEMQNMGMHDVQGRRLPSLQDLLRRLQERRQQQLSRYNLDSVMDDVRKALEDVIKTEREGIDKQVADIREKAARKDDSLSAEMKQKLLQSLEDNSARHRQTLDNLPRDIGGQVKELNKYDFMDEEARRKFQELLNMLKKRTMDSYARELTQNLKSLDPSALKEMKEMLKALNEMLEQRRRGIEPDFEGFMEKFGHFFGPNPPKSLDELMDRLQQQMAQAQALFQSMSPEQRESLQSMLKSLLDDEIEEELFRLGANLQMLNPTSDMSSEYSFFGDESISYEEALKLMEMLQKMDKLEDQINESRFSRLTDSIDKEAVRELLGDQSAEELEAINQIGSLLEESGYIRRQNGKYALTPRGMRKIGDKALASVFARLHKDRLGGHRLAKPGGGGERMDDTKKLEFGDDFDLHIEKTIMNALRRHADTPVRLIPDDFEVFKEEASTRSATVLLLDLSLSMPMHGNFQAAKVVAIALDSLIRTKYPKDSLYILGFSSYARRMSKEDLTYISWDDFDPYTNMQHGFMVARRLLEKDRSANKQILLISDGEPTAHIENGRVFFQYPPSLRSIQMTLKEAANCARNGIVINTFMLRGSGYFNSFITQLARLNRGRVFFTSADSLGEYIIVDYLSNKKQKIA